MHRKGSPTSPRRVWNLRSEWSCYQIVPPRHRQNGHGVRFSMDGKSWKIFEVRTTVTGDLKDLKSGWDIWCRLSKYLKRKNGHDFLMELLRICQWLSESYFWGAKTDRTWQLNRCYPSHGGLGPKPLIDWWKNPRFFVLGHLGTLGALNKELKITALCGFASTKSQWFS